MTDPVPARLRRAQVTVDLEAVRANVALLAATVAPAQLMAVVKADGYGHGLVPVARAARAGGASWLGCAFFEEALALRESGDSGRILAWLAVPGEDYAAVIAAGVDVAAYSVEQVEEIAAAARSVEVPARVHLKVDTGLSRGGAVLADWPAVVAAARAAEQDGALRVTGVWTHLASSDEPDDPVNDEQEQAFDEAVAVASAAGLRPEVTHLANSAAALTRPSARRDLVRCGLAIYGLSPTPGHHDAAALGLRPAMTVASELAVVKRLEAGSGISYGHTYRTEADTTVGLVPVGYADGVLRSASSSAQVAVAGARRPVVGRVCMDQFVVDLDDAEARAGDAVVLFGPGDAGEPTAQDWAEACGTISYEIVTRIGGRFTRVYESADLAEAAS